MDDDRTDDRRADRSRAGGGCVLLARSLRDSELWRWDAEHLRLWIHLLLSVHTKDEPVTVGSVVVGYGQVLKSYRRLADECAWLTNRRRKTWPPSRVKRMLDRFAEHEMVTLLGPENGPKTGPELGTGLGTGPKASAGTLITISNFKRYQDFQTYRTELRTGQKEELGTELRTITTNNYTTTTCKGSLAPSAVAYPQTLPKAKGRYVYPPTFDSVWELFPVREGGNPKLPAYRAWRARVVNDGVDPADLLAGTVRYAEYLTAKGKIGTEYVLQAATFFGPSERWAETWTSRALQPRRTTNTMSVGSLQDLL